MLTQAGLSALQPRSVTSLAALAGLSFDVTVTLWPAFVLFADEAIFRVGVTSTPVCLELIWPPAIFARYLALSVGVSVVEYRPDASGVTTRSCFQPWTPARCSSSDTGAS